MQWGPSLMWTSSICKMTSTSWPGRGFLITCHQQTPLCNICSLGVTAGVGTAKGTHARTLRPFHLFFILFLENASDRKDSSPGKKLHCAAVTESPAHACEHLEDLR